jgi:hypothetical protein
MTILVRLIAGPPTQIGTPPTVEAGVIVTLACEKAEKAQRKKRGIRRNRVEMGIYAIGPTYRLLILQYENCNLNFKILTH